MTLSYDTMVAAHLLNEELPVGLEPQAGIELGVDNWGKGKIDFGIADKPPTNFAEMGYYCARDTAYSHMLYEIQREKFKEHPGVARLFKYLVLPGLESLAQMELNGIWLDLDRVKAQEVIFTEQREREHAALLEHVPEPFRAKANFASPIFLRKWLYGEKPDGLGLHTDRVTAKTKAPSTDEEALKGLAGQHPAIENLLSLTEAAKALQFLKQWQTWVTPEQRIHAYFNPTGTVTGRRSAGNPNLQQVPRDPRLRGCFAAPPGWLLLEVDFSAVEVRLAAWFAEEFEMLRVFAAGGDIYRYVAAQIYGIEQHEVTKLQRQGAKAVVLGFLYGMGAASFVVYSWETFGVRFTYDEAVEFRDAFFRMFPELQPWHSRQRTSANRDLHVTSPFGRVRNLQKILSFDQQVRGKAERQAINSPVQGFGGDLTLAASIELTQTLDRSKAFIVGDIHDALLFQVREDSWREVARMVLTTMENPAIFETFDIHPPVRLKADAKIGHRWSADATEFAMGDIDTLVLPE